jgi:mannose-1-phosphate guanylyltransferase
MAELTRAEPVFMICSFRGQPMNTLLKPSETDDTNAIAAAYLYAAKGDPNAALTQAVSDAVVAIEELRSRLEQAEQVVSYGFTRGEFVTRPHL